MNVKDNIIVIAINKTCTLTSRSRLESYKRLVSVSGGERLGLELLRLVPIPGCMYYLKPVTVLCAVCSWC